VHLWTINNPRAAERWLLRGVDGVFTDDPSALLGLFERRWEGSNTTSFCESRR
jgi:glycerophosphoryl diester phosphodiesterase